MVKKSLFMMSLLIWGLFFCCGRENLDYKKVQNEMQNFQLNRDIAYNLSNLALNCIQKEYPNKPGHVINSAEDIHLPSEMHPAFYGCFDWHSSVHGHWMLVKLLKMFPDIKNANQIREALDANLTPENINKEVFYFQQENRKSFERTYGWSWLLKLFSELQTWNDPQGQKWKENLLPLASLIRKRYLDFFPKQTYPIRRGVHANSAFGLGFALDYARISQDKRLEDLLIKITKQYYFPDKNYSVDWEPGGDDFLSPSLMEADLMRRVLTKDQFLKWFNLFLPRIPENILKPVTVSDRSDPKIVHLDGLNLSRAWCMFGIASVLPDENPKKITLIKAGLAHLKTGSLNILSGNYVGEHWLASFAVHAYSSLSDLKEN